MTNSLAGLNSGWRKLLAQYLIKTFVAQKIDGSSLLKYKNLYLDKTKLVLKKILAFN